MNNILKIALFVIPIIALIATPIVIHHNKNNSTQSLQDTSTANSTSSPSHPMHVAATKSLTSPTMGMDSRQIYDMPEPFAHELPWSNCCGMHHPMSPAAWMHVMNTMMNSMQITQMMHQMATLPKQVMNPATSHPHGLMPNNTSTSIQPMNPKEYKKWYEQQQKTLRQDNN
jgi:hypothetical protein